MIDDYRVLVRTMGVKLVASVLGVGVEAAYARNAGKTLLTMFDLYRLSVVWGDIIDFDGIVRNHLVRVAAYREKRGLPSLMHRKVHYGRDQLLEYPGGKKR